MFHIDRPQDLNEIELKSIWFLNVQKRKELIETTSW